MESLFKTVLVPIHRDGWMLIAIAAVATLVLFTLSPLLGWLGTALTLWLALFFRDPPRLTPVRAGLLVAPADGLVVSVGPAQPPAVLDLGETPTTRVAIFLNAFDVHVNRTPADGRVRRIVYSPGRKTIALSDKASADNERNALVIELPDGRPIVVVQIAGLLARRIRCWVDEGAVLRAGERFGMIRFGSRVEVYLPEGVAPLVAEGQRCVAGETIIADLTSSEAARVAEAR